MCKYARRGVRLCVSSCFEVSNLARVRGMGPLGLRAFYRSDLTKGQKSSRGQVAFSRKNPRPKCSATLGSKVIMRSDGSQSEVKLLRPIYAIATKGG